MEIASSEKAKRKLHPDKYVIPVDGSCYGAGDYRVYIEGEDIYDAMLNQTDVG